MTNLLAYDPDDRISAKDALRHSWFADLVKTEQNLKRRNRGSNSRTKINASPSQGLSSNSKDSSGRRSKLKDELSKKDSKKDEKKDNGMDSTTNSKTTGRIMVWIVLQIVKQLVVYHL